MSGVWRAGQVMASFSCQRDVKSHAILCKVHEFRMGTVIGTCTPKLLQANCPFSIAKATKGDMRKDHAVCETTKIYSLCILYVLCPAFLLLVKNIKARSRVAKDSKLPISWCHGTSLALPYPSLARYDCQLPKQVSIVETLLLSHSLHLVDKHPLVIGK